MSKATIARMIGLMAAALGAVLSSGALAWAQLNFDPTWEYPAYGAVREDVLAWAKASDADDEAQERIEKLWAEGSQGDVGRVDLLERVAESIAIVEPRAEELVKVCRADYKGPAAPDASWLADADIQPLVRNNLRLYYARWLAQYKLYDEVLAALEGLAPADVVDPASLLFYRMVAYQQLVQPDEARATLVQLLERREQLPERYRQVAQLLERDLASISDESLDHIARRMSDIRRRLAYGRAGEKVQSIERGVVESLDRKIEELEKQQQQQQSSSPSGGSAQQSRPMEDSRLPSMQAPMQVEQRDIGHESGWGDLPPHEREQALQQIGRDYPAHYRDLIEQYFRELATESDPSAN